MSHAPKKTKTIMGSRASFTPKSTSKPNFGVGGRKLSLAPVNANFRSLNPDKSVSEARSTDFKETAKENSELQLDFPSNDLSTIERKHTLTNVSLAAGDNDRTHQIKVVARFRPLNKVEKEMESKGAGSICATFPNDQSVKIKNSMNTETNFTLDRIFHYNTTQKEIYDEVAFATINDVLKGYNGTIFAYGQSGSGKTYSMYGNDIYDEEVKGVIPRAINHIFNHTNDPKNENIKFELKFSMLEIYKENLYDLLNPETKISDIKIKEHPKKGIYVSGVAEEYISSEEEFIMLIESADENRAVASTGLNNQSSRSHLLFQLEIIQTMPDDTQKRGMLNLVDLAGSEKVAKTHAVGQTLEEAKKINLSLSTLGNVIHSLTSSNPNEFIPYRDSKLTRILQDSLGGNYKTTLIVTCSPHIFNSEETISTLKFAQRAKKLKNKVKMNIKRSVEQLEAIIEELTKQLRCANDEILRLKGTPIPIDIFKTEDSMNNNDDKNYTAKNNLASIPEFDHKNANGGFYSIEATEEINSLHEKIESLTNENIKLTEKINELDRETNYEKIIDELKITTSRNIEELKSLTAGYSENINEELRAENKILRENYNNMEAKYISLLNKAGQGTKPNMYDRSIDELITTTKINFDEFFLDSKQENTLTQSYRNIFSQTKQQLSLLLNDFLKKKDIFSNKRPNPEAKHVKDTIDNDDVMKSSYIKLISLINFYERLMFNFVNRTTVDLKKFEFESKIKSEISEKCKNFNNIFVTYLDVLEEIQNFAFKSEIAVNKTSNAFHVNRKNSMLKSSFVNCDEVIPEENGKEIFHEHDIDTISEKDERPKRKERIIFSNDSDSSSLVESSEADLTVERSKPKKASINRTNTMMESTKVLEQIIEPFAPSSKKLMRADTIGSSHEPKHHNFNIKRQVNRNPTRSMKNMNMLLNHLLKHENHLNEEPEPKNVLELRNPFLRKGSISTKNMPNFSPESKIVRSNAKKMTQSAGWGVIKEALFKQEIGNIQVISEETKVIKKELELYKNVVETLTKEINSNQNTKLETEKIIQEYQMNQKRIMENEINNFAKIIKVYKCFYEKDLAMKSNVVDELTKLIDEMSLNGAFKTIESKEFNNYNITLTSNSITPRGSNNKNMFQKYSNQVPSNKSFSNDHLANYFEYKKNKIVNDSKYLFETKNSVTKIAEAILAEGGTASRKLDYILFQIENNYEDLIIKYGSGLNGIIPSKSPLSRNLFISLVGDTCSEADLSDDELELD